MTLAITQRKWTLHHDFETRSKLDIKKTGASRYSRHESTEVLMLAYTLDEEPIRQWIPIEGEPMPDELQQMIHDPDVIKCAWNATFERYIWQHVLGIHIPLEQWRDTMVLAHTCAFPGKLAQACNALKLPPELAKAGQMGAKHIRWFCAPDKRKNSETGWKEWQDFPERWGEFLHYNRMDVEAERAIHRLLHKFDLPEHEWEAWQVDQRINDAGLPVNTDLCEKAIAVRESIVGEKIAELKRITGLQNPNSTTQFLPWARMHGYRYQDLRKEHIQAEVALLEDPANGPMVATPAEKQRDRKGVLLRALKLRQETSKASLKKFDAILSHVDEDGYLRGTLQFAGAGRTWRAAGRVYQPQNLPRPVAGLDGVKHINTAAGHKMIVGGTQIEIAKFLTKVRLGPVGFKMLYQSPTTALTTAVRTVVQAEKGYVFVDADLKAIENCVLGYLSGDEEILKVYEQGLDPYVAFAVKMFHMAYEDLMAEVKEGNKRKRQIAKPAVLGCGYRMGAGEMVWNEDAGEYEMSGLLEYARNMGVILTQEEADEAVAVWRATHRRVPEFWDLIEAAAVEAVNTRRETEAGPVWFDIKWPFLRMNLPSGRALHYYHPEVTYRPVPPTLEQRMEYKEMAEDEGVSYNLIERRESQYRDQRSVLVYEGNIGYTWGEVQTYSGKLTENAVQAIARDLLFESIVRCDKAGLDVRLHVHDEILLLAKEEEADDVCSQLLDIMHTKSDWAKGIPVSAEAHISEFLVKD